MRLVRRSPRAVGERARQLFRFDPFDRYQQVAIAVSSAGRRTAADRRAGRLPARPPAQWSVC